MQSLFNFIVKPKNGRYNNKKTIDGQDVLIQGVAPGETLDIVVQRVMVGSAATAGAPSTLTTAEKITAFI